MEYDKAKVADERKPEGETVPATLRRLGLLRATGAVSPSGGEDRDQGLIVHMTTSQLLPQPGLLQTAGPLTMQAMAQAAF